MPMSIRLDPETRAALDPAARTTGRSRSDLVRDAVLRYLELLRSEQMDRSAVEVLAKYIGCVNSGGSERSRETGRGFRTLLEERARARRPD